MNNNKIDDMLLQRCRDILFSAVIGDVMDTMGFINQFLPQRIGPLTRNMICVGRAMPVQEADCTGPFTKPFGKMLEALDNLQNNEVYICAGSSLNYAQWGGLMSNRAKRLGAAGAVLNGYSRDTKEILELGFPVFSSGCYAKDQGVRGQVIDYRCPITFENGVVVKPGDIIFADMDGVVTIPQEIEKETLEKAFLKCNEENKVRTAILNGMPTMEAFEKFGVM
ncbi:MAG: RraA family protein [Clostridia bacterium]